jgi:hypothetical protein
MNKIAENIVISTLKTMIVEQAPPAPPAGAAGTALETDNAESDNGDSPFTPAEKRFLGKFDAYGTQHLGIIYSLSDIGIREFITRSGKDLNLTPEILLKMIKDGFVKIIPYTGYGRNDDYTIELQLSLDDVAGLGKDDKAKAEKGSTAGGGGAAPPAPELAWVVKYGDVLSESAKIAKRLLSGTKHNYVNESKTIKKMPNYYVNHVNQMIELLSTKKYTINEKQRLIETIFNNLKLSDKQIEKSYEFHKKQKRLQKK